MKVIPCLLGLAVLVAHASPEDELAAQLPEIFAKSAAHYKALDAAAAAQMKVKSKSEKGKSAEEFRIPHSYFRDKGELHMRSVLWWTAGHYPGSLWYLYEATGDEGFKDRATVWTELLAPNAKVTDNHDVGFIMYCSYGNARRLLKTDKYDALLRETAGSLCQRYNEKLGLIRSWGKLDEKKNFLVIPDNMMNLELLEWAAGESKGEKGKVKKFAARDFAKIAQSHADVTMKNHFRPDGGCYHVLDYDQETGKVKEIKPGQGMSCKTAWARGESWAIYGYTMMYRTSGYVRYLDFAKKLADYAISHPNMPVDGIPYWDYGAPGEERDSSAGAIMASALVELSQYVGEADRVRYRAFAVKQMLALASPAYFSEGDEVGHFLLKHGVGHKPAKSEIDVPLNYGDYYFLEALLRFRKLKAQEQACAPVAALLPAKAALPDDEAAWRMSAKAKRARAVAEKALSEPIPDTPDDLYGEYWTTGNRTHYQGCRDKRLYKLGALAVAEANERKGRFLPRIEEYLAAVCDMKSWVLPAHDWSDGGRGTFRGTWITTDLGSTDVGAQLACIVRLLGDRLKPETVARVKANVERRVFAPVRREAPTFLFADTAVGGVREKRHWWIDGGNNWNAVCWDNVACAALGLLDDPADRAFFVTAADRAADRYIADGFASDGYCSEGMGYWNYGFGHHLLTGRMLGKLTGGKFDFFRRPKQRLAAAYARAYTLREGASPAFADGNGAANPRFLELVDQFWPDLPKDLPPTSEFPDGQVWLFRDADGLSVAFKGGHNGELHNHNDIGSYYLMDGKRFVAGDPGGETYTARTFSKRRYESKVLNSFGHPVPVVGGKLQSVGSKAAAKVVSKGKSKCEKGNSADEVVLDLTAAYDVPALKSLTRTYLYDRTGKTFAVRDHAAFAEPTAFEDCYITFGDKANVTVNVLKGGTATPREETIENPDRASPHRFAWKFDKPVTEAEIEFVFKEAEGM